MWAEWLVELFGETDGAGTGAVVVAARGMRSSGTSTGVRGGARGGGSRRDGQGDGGYVAGGGVTVRVGGGVGRGLGVVTGGGLAATLEEEERGISGESCECRERFRCSNSQCSVESTGRKLTMTTRLGHGWMRSRRHSLYAFE